MNRIWHTSLVGETITVSAAYDLVTEGGAFITGEDGTYNIGVDAWSDKKVPVWHTSVGQHVFIAQAEITGESMFVKIDLPLSTAGGDTLLTADGDGLMVKWNTRTNVFHG